jgi:hypothetical protein
VSFQAEAGTSGRMGEYRRLIGAGCGGVPPSEVDHVLGMLLEVKPPGPLFYLFLSHFFTIDVGIGGAQLFVICLGKDGLMDNVISYLAVCILFQRILVFADAITCT